MLIQAAANEWKVPASECSATNSTITHSAPAAPPPTARSRKPRPSCEVPKDIKLKDPKDWKIAGKPLKRLDTADKVVGKMEYGIDVKLPGMLQRLDQGLPGVRRQGEELRRRQGREDAGREEGRAGRRQRGRRGRRHVLARQDRARRAADRVGHRRQREAQQRHDRRIPEGRPRRRHRRSSATRTATSKPPSPAPPRRSRPSTPIRTRTTPAWSR